MQLLSTAAAAVSFAWPGASTTCHPASCRCCHAAAGGPYVVRWFNWLTQISTVEGVAVNHTLKDPAFGGGTSGACAQTLAYCMVPLPPLLPPLLPLLPL